MDMENHLLIAPHYCDRDGVARSNEERGIQHIFWLGHSFAANL
jgi:hypothetical protein